MLSWSSSKNLVASWNGSDLPLPTKKLQPDPEPQILGSWSRDANYNYYVPGQFPHLLCRVVMHVEKQHYTAVKRTLDH
jgi:hypothetical protein